MIRIFTHTPGARRGPTTLLLGLACTLAAFTTSVVVPDTASAASLCSNRTGTHQGYYYQMWTAGGGSACLDLGSGGHYSTSWNKVNNFVAGMGWRPGGRRTVTYWSSLSASGGRAQISLYGWTTNPLVEYYIIDNWRGSRPGSGTYKGTVTSNGGTYNIYETTRVNAPSIIGRATFHQYLAVRTSPRSSGSITTGNFFDAWARHGMKLGTFNYMIVATEAFGGNSGSSYITVR